MDKWNQTELDAASLLISTVIVKCEKMISKFDVGTSQHSLLQNRIKALYISKDLIENRTDQGQYSKVDYEQALPPVVSIISKTQKAQSKYVKGTTQYNRFTPMIESMSIARQYIDCAIQGLTTG